MSDAVYDQLAAVEDRLWWHTSRRDLIRLWLRRVTLPANASALDIGCGTGGAFGLLSEYAQRVVGLDRSPRALELAHRKHPAAALRLGDANTLTDHFDDESFDLVTVLNVLYHQWIHDEVDVLRQAGELLRPGGALLVTEPAFSSLFRRHDRVVLGKRRYTLGRVRRMVETAGLEWVGGSYFNMASFPPAWCLARLDRLRAPDVGGPIREITVPPVPINEALKLMMAGERLAMRLFGRVPLGVTLVGLARRSVASRVVATRRDTGNSPASKPVRHETASRRTCCLEPRGVSHA